ncbi:oligosaccharide flippase family protein, partial [Photobacterium kishitanii]|uniref:oligosaccharide flippase family protein n=1 Tax=Photobacterium kishitanii TaxID=318456 RepID=UPI000D1652FC
MNSNVRRFLNSSISLYVIQFVNLVAPLLILPYLTRILSVDDFGQVSIFISLCGLAFVLNDFGFGLSATYRISKNINNIRYINELIGAIYLAKIFLIVISIIIFTAYYIYNSDFITIPHVYLYAIGVFIFQSMQPTWFFQGIEKMRNITIFHFLSKLTYVILVLILVKNNNDVGFVFASYLLSHIVASLISNYLLYKEGYKFVFVSKDKIIKELKYSFDFFLSRASVSIYTTSSALILGTLSGQGQAAYYSAAEKLYQAMQSFTGPVSQALYPILAKKSDHKFLIKIIMSLLIPLVIVVMSVAFFSKDILSIIFGSDYINGYQVLSVFCIIVVINYISANFGYPAFSSLNRVNIVNKTVMIGSLVQIFLLIIIYKFGMLSALTLVLSILITESIVMT